MTLRAKVSKVAKERRVAPAQLLSRLDSSEYASFAPDRVKILYGVKAAGLLLLPPKWTPPFAVIPTSIFSQWRDQKGRLTHILSQQKISLEKITGALKTQGFKQIILRSSADNESIDDRGRYLSILEERDSDAKRICRDIERIYNEFSKENLSDKIAIIIQGYVAPELSGHLSNELHLTPTRNQWRFEVERPAYSPPQGLNSKFSPSADTSAGLAKNPEETINQILRKVGHWANKVHASRSHFEWCITNSRLWLVQFDIENETSSGADPRLMPLPRRASNSKSLVNRSIFKKYSVGQEITWPKIKNINDFTIGDEAAKHELYFASAENVSKFLENNRDRSRLAAELDAITDSRAVLRTDSITDKLPKFNLPRTHTVSGTNAVEWLRRQIKNYKRLRINLKDVCFIAHGFIPARASAWSYYIPGSDVVEIDSLWGIPDGLQFLPHDSFQCDSSSGQLVSEKIRFKPQLLQEQADGSWRYVPIARQFGRTRSLSREALETIATQTVAIAEKLNGPAQVMWFCDIPPEVNLGEHLPWYRTNESVERVDLRRPPVRTIEISRVEDLKAVAKLKNASVVLCVLPQADLIRDEKFLDSVIETAKHNNLPVELAGSILGHAFYRLRSEGITVYAAEPYAAYYRVRGRKVFQKLVRDNIPEKISKGGENAIQARIIERDVIFVLLAKLIEEALEFSKAADGQRVEELADIYEVLRAIAQRTNTTLPEIENVAEGKRLLRGGFDANIMLLETRKPLPGKRVSADNSRSFSLKEIGSVRLEKNTATIPFASLMHPDAKISFALPGSNGSLSIVARFTSQGIELNFRARGKRGNDQLHFPFDQ